MQLIIPLSLIMSTFQMALALWNATGNEQTFFHKVYVADRSYSISPAALMSLEPKYGISKGLADEICKSVFENDIALLTLEMAEPRMMQVQKDKRVTFETMIGTIGK